MKDVGGKEGWRHKEEVGRKVRSNIIDPRQITSRPLSKKQRLRDEHD